MRFKTILVASLFAAAMALASPALVMASAGEKTAAAEEVEEGGHGAATLNWLDFSNEQTPPLAAMFLNFALVGILVFLILRKPIGSKIKLRKESLENALAEAKQAKQEAQNALALARQKQEELEQEMARIREVVLEGGTADSGRIAQEAEARAKRMSQDTVALVEQEIARMSQSLRAELVEEIVALAKDVVLAKIKAADHDKLAGEYLESLGKGVAANADRQ